MKSPDYGMWQAMHSDCGPEGCGHCVVIDLEFTDEEFKEISVAAYWTGEPVSVFIHKAIALGMQNES